MRWLFCISALVVAAVLPRAGAGPKDERKEPHPHLVRALHELREAHHELREAPNDFGGHKEAAQRDIHRAIEQIEKALKLDNGKLPESFKPDADYKKHKHHPHLHEALHELREAYKELKEGAHDFHGHREEAMEAIRAAEKQVEACLKHAK